MVWTWQPGTAMQGISFAERRDTFAGFESDVGRWCAHCPDQGCSADEGVALVWWFFHRSGCLLDGPQAADVCSGLSIALGSGESCIPLPIPAIFS